MYVYLPSCIIQGSSRAHTLSPYLYLSNFSLKVYSTLAAVITSSLKPFQVSTVLFGKLYFLMSLKHWCSANIMSEVFLFVFSGIWNCIWICNFWTSSCICICIFRFINKNICICIFGNPNKSICNCICLSKNHYLIEHGNTYTQLKV